MLLVTQPGSLPGYSASGDVVVDGGATLAVQAGGTGEWDAPSLMSLLLTNGFASGTSLAIDVVGTNSFTYGSDLGMTQAAKSVVKLGSGTLVLNAANTYTGSLIASPGSKLNVQMLGRLIGVQIYLANLDDLALTLPGNLVFGFHFASVVIAASTAP
jgi:autotransporter-associated beta strand protein